MPGFPVHHQLLELAQTHVHRDRAVTISSLCHPFLLLPSIFPSIRGFSNESVLCIRWPKCWSFNILATWYKELTHWKSPWCWERLKAGGEGDDRGWDGWIASLIQWTWTCETAGRQWGTGRPGLLQSMGSQSVRNDWATELNWTEYSTVYMYHFFIHSSVDGHLGCFHS